MIKSYKYIGDNSFLKEQTALGMIINNKFKVQVNNLKHPWAWGWHETLRNNWKEIE